MLVHLDGTRTKLAAEYDKNNRNKDVIAHAILDYQPSDKSELTLSANDKICVTQKDPSGWWQVMRLIPLMPCFDFLF